MHSFDFRAHEDIADSRRAAIAGDDCRTNDASWEGKTQSLTCQQIDTSTM